MARNGWLVVGACCALPVAMTGQTGYPLALPSGGARFTEISRTTILSQTAGGDVRREMSRDALFSVTARGDTLVVAADSLLLRETLNGTPRTLDTDGFVGGRFRLLLPVNGIPVILARPFVPDDLADVSDLARAMDDFFPQPPPLLTPGRSGSGFAGRHWNRLADSAGLARYRWQERWGVDTTRTVADTVSLTLQETREESGALLWDTQRGPLAWHKEIVSNSTARVRGQLVRTRLEQRVDGKRLP